MHPACLTVISLNPMLQSEQIREPHTLYHELDERKVSDRMSVFADKDNSQFWICMYRILLKCHSK